MKGFNLWRQERTGLLYNMQDDAADLEEGKISRFFKTVATKLTGPLKKLFKLSSYSFGQKRKMKVKIPIPANLTESVKNQKNNGTQVEMLSGMYLSEELIALGFDVDLRLENSSITIDKMSDEIDKLQERIVGNTLTGVSDNKKLMRRKKTLAKEYAVRKNYGMATARRLVETVKKDLTDYPGMFKVVIDSAGYAGEGKTKADIMIEYEVQKINESVVVPKMRSYALSHKYTWEISRGTQINSLYGLIYAIDTGGVPKTAGPKIVHAHAKKLLEKKFGAKGLEEMERLKYLWGHKKTRVSGSKNGVTDKTRYKVVDQGSQDDYEKYLKKFYDYAAKLAEENPLTMIKHIGIEEGVDHFMVVFNNSTKKYDVYSSVDSKKYKSFIDKMYDDEFRKEIKVSAKQNTLGIIDLEYFWRGNSIYKTRIESEETNVKKSKSNVMGIKIHDMDDAVSSHAPEFEAVLDDIPAGLVAKAPPPKPKASSSGKLKRIDNSKPPATVKKKMSAEEAKQIWSRAARKKHEASGKDPDLKNRIMKKATPAIQYIMAGLTGKEAIEHALGE